MNDQKKDIELIEQYLDGLLPDRDRMRFEQRLQMDNAFNALFLDLKKIYTASRTSKLQEKLKQIKAYEDMIPSDNELDLIHRFIRNELNAEEQIEFEKKVQQSSFKKKYQDTLLLQQGARFSTLEIIKTNIEHWEKEAPKIKKNPRRSFLLLTRWAAAISILVFASLWLWQANAVTKSDVLFSNYFTPYPITTIQRTTHSEKKNLIQDPYLAYENQSYDVAIEYLLPLSSQNDSLATFYLGNAYLASGKTKKAIRIFKQLNIPQLNHQITWYLALSLLKDKNQAEAIAILKKLTSHQSSYASKAKNLLKDLEENR